MRKFFPLLILLGIIFTLAPAFAQTPPPIDPETMKFLQDYNKQNTTPPPEILALMPPGLEITEKQWSVESWSKMLLQLTLVSSMGSTRIDNTEDYTLDLRLQMTAYNMNSDMGKMTANQTLEPLRKDAQIRWLDLHKESQEYETTYYKPEKIEVPHGYYYIQKIFVKAHSEGEGMVPEKTNYCGYLYLEVEAGCLTAEVQTVPNTKAGIEKWLKHIADSAAKLKLEDYFK